MSLSIPLKLKSGSFDHSKNIKESIDESLRLLLSTPCNTFVPDPCYGFVFNNFRFEMFNEKEGVIFNSKEKLTDSKELYEKQISGTSRSIHTFASEMKAAISTYEKRLTDLIVSMNYERATRLIRIEIKGKIVETLEAYKYVTYIHVWN